ncbi:hypothetical protein U1Q18_035173 [Sarracenia purpurea var. burkii]
MFCCLPTSSAIVNMVNISRNRRWRETNALFFSYEHHSLSLSLSLSLLSSASPSRSFFTSTLLEFLSDMNYHLNDNESLIGHIQQLEHERDKLRKDIEQLCMQQAGPSYLAVATRMHFQRTAGLEQEIENLKKKLAACSREKSDLQEELSEAYRIKSQLADLHAAEVSKNMEAEKQVKFFHGCVAAAFAERDHSIMEAEKAKEKEEVMLQKLNNFQRRVEELTSDFLEEKKLTTALQIDLEEQNKQNETFKKIINKFYEIRQYSLNGFCEDGSWQDKCECLLQDSAEMWDFNDQGETSPSKYITECSGRRSGDIEKIYGSSSKQVMHGIGN